MTSRAGPQRKLDRSRYWRGRAERVIPLCAQTFSKSPSSFVQGVAPSFLSRAQGATVWDVDGNSYLDFIMGLGPVILGHADTAVNEAAREQMENGVSFSLPHLIEVEVAEILCDIIPGAEMVRFAKNGSDVTAAAVRVARAYTGREIVACCGYHGWHDWYIGTTNRDLGVPGAVKQLTTKFPYNDLASLEQLFLRHGDNIACVILEPVVFDHPHSGFLEGIRQICDRHGALLIFDEVITGLRLSLGGAQQYFGVIPDLSCFGKALANGFPLSAIAGRAQIMRLLEKVFFSGTHAGETVSLAACRATIHEMQRRQGIDHLWRVGTKLKDGTNNLSRKRGLEKVLNCTGLPPFTCIRFYGVNQKESLLMRSLFQQEALKRGILTHGNHMLSLAHDENVINQVLTVYDEIFEILADAFKRGDWAKKLEGPPLQPVIRQG